MNIYLLNVWDTWRSSYWFVPTFFAVGVVTLSLMVPLLDAAVAKSGRSLPEWILTTTPTARATLSAMARAMEPVTGTVLSITIVTLSLTSQQFGPRLLRSFLYDLPIQVTPGVFLSTGRYCLLVLRIVERHESGAATPNFFLLLAVMLSVFRTQHGDADRVHSSHDDVDPGSDASEFGTVCVIERTALTTQSASGMP